MRINPKMFAVADDATPVETQEFDGRKIELFYMNDYDMILNEYIAKGQFAAWSSVDGFNYRLFIEKGYYETVSELYSQPINKIWVDFWDVTDKISKNYSRKVLLPIGAVAIGVCIGAMFMPEPLGNYVAIGVLLAALIGMVFSNGMIKKKIMKANVDSRDLIVKELGQDNFDKLLDTQKDYMDKYYDALNEEIEAEENIEADIEDNTQIEENKSDVIDATVVEEVKDNEETNQVEDKKSE